MTAAFRPTVLSLDDRLLPAANLFAANQLVAAPMAHADADVDAVWVGHGATAAVECGVFQDIGNWFGDTARTVGSAIKGVFYPDPLAGARGQFVATIDLRPGDILLEASGGAKAGTIGFFTGSDYSHAAIYTGNGQLVEAIGSGVRQTSVTNYLNDDAIQRVMVLRVPGLSEADEARLAAFAERQVGKSYNTDGAAALPGRDWVKVQTFGLVDPRAIAGNAERPDYYCSELVTAAYQSIGRPLFQSMEQSPGDLANLYQLHEAQVVGNLYDAANHRQARA
jgi:cell wall-associated NlpC family hydrolase